MAPLVYPYCWGGVCGTLGAAVRACVEIQRGLSGIAAASSEPCPAVSDRPLAPVVADAAAAAAAQTVPALPVKNLPDGADGAVLGFVVPKGHHSKHS